MKQEDIPQDDSPLVNHFRELCYAKDNTGHYTTGLSTGWEVKSIALAQAWEDIRLRAEQTLNEIHQGKATPLAYFLALNMMDVKLLAQYVGEYKFRVRRHLYNPLAYAKLTDAQLEKYARVFSISLSELKSFS